MARVALKDVLPPPVKWNGGTLNYYDHANDAWFKKHTDTEFEKSVTIKAKQPIPPYLKRARGFKPSKHEDFGDSREFPEIHIAQYSLDMGRKVDRNSGRKTLPVTVDENDKDLIPKVIKDKQKEEEIDLDEKNKEIEESTQSTKAALEKIVYAKLSAAQPKNVPTQSSGSKYIKYKSSQQSAASNSSAKERIIRMVEMPVDPLDPPKFEHKRVPKASGSPPVPILRSPPRLLTAEDSKNWNLPPCNSNWKNPKGYTIPLDKRLAADNRGLQDVQISINFAKLPEALYVAEEKAKEGVAMRSKVQKEMMMKEKENKETELRELARKARFERLGVAPQNASTSSERVTDDHMMADSERVRNGALEKETKEGREQRLEMKKIYKERCRKRLEARDAVPGKRSKIIRDRDRDISEKVALGMATTGRTGEVQYDERLFNQDKGMDFGFAADDSHNIYNQGLFTAQPTLFTLYRAKKDVDSDMHGGSDENLDKIIKTGRFKPDRAFAGTSERSGRGGGPVEFEKNAEEEDPYGQNQFLDKMKKGK